MYGLSLILIRIRFSNNVTDLLKGGIFTDIVRPGANNLLMRCSITDMPALDFRFKNYVTVQFAYNTYKYLDVNMI